MKAEGKKLRDDKEKVMEVLFGLFEKHQYYNIKDLVKETRQPVTYLKVSLSAVCLLLCSDVYFLISFTGGPEGGVRVQREGAAQEHVGAQAGIPPLQVGRSGRGRVCRSGRYLIFFVHIFIGKKIPILLQLTGNKETVLVMDC